MGFLLVILERPPPHLFLYLLLFKEKQRWKQERTAGFEIPGSLNFYLIYLFIKTFYYYFILFFYQGVMWVGSFKVENGNRLN